jgi:hypothetical protein
MSMEVDLSTPLTNKERAYLLERGKYADVDRMDNSFGTTGDADLLTGDGSGPNVKQLATGEAAAQRRQELLAELALLDQHYGGSDDSDEQLPPYEKWPVAELDAELTARELPVTGNKSEKAKALYANDEKLSAQQ